MRKILLASLFALLATSVLAPDPADAARRKSKVVKQPVSVDTYYYSGVYKLNDRARPFFGSPVRGYEFFQFISDRATQ